MNSGLCVSTSKSWFPACRSRFEDRRPQEGPARTREAMDQWACRCTARAPEQEKSPGQEWGPFDMKRTLMAAWGPDEDVEDWRGGVAATKPLVTWLCSREVRNLYSY
ncbi:hypothetical protein TYRP_018506 [Tyrophagus putrescentiae]|nr:hypothetical protein TYRP_018506 [Tyrophagus putrescentiae]